MKDQATRCPPRQLSYYRQHGRWPDFGRKWPGVTKLDLLASAIMLAGILSLLYITK